MTLLIAGLILWIAAHYFKRLMPAQRAAMGDKGKGLVALVLVVSLILMIIGYRGADFIPVWTPPTFLNGINNLAMLVAFWIYGSSAAKGAKAWPAYKTRHPQLLAVKIWAAAHLLVNGDLASIILFGGMLAWAVGSVILINRAAPDWTAPPHAGRKTYIRLAVITLVAFSITAGIHIALGVNPFS
ncbi:NnrU family protein [Sulfitobacter sp. F26169L]|uniref:NnrU family protein n=1 Tax=Sulfitobacter sp. F26169L TaxID=2996015 RepID=UPI002260C2EF|nr:NnrU family protein [Sulfitobacter sp. F26169L]MCX7567230.1 NnrU family protein [Sulfitobacter sp. F26169L]